MSVQRQENWLGQQRVDVPHLRAVESSIASDFDLLAGGILAGQVAHVVSGFSIVVSPSPVGSPATNVLVNTANGVLLHPLATDAGTIFQSPVGRSQEQLTSTNTRVSGSFTSSSTNYIGIDLRRTADFSTSDTVQFLDPVALQESPKIVPLARTLDYVLIISTTDFSSTPGVCPIAKIVTDANNNVVSITDCRRMYFRLGSGGSNPTPQNTYAWVGNRTGGTESASDFSVADKSIGDFKTWMSAIMSRIQEVAGGQYWYSPVTPTNIKLMRSGTPLANGEYFSYSAGTLTWKGLTFLLPSSPGQYNTITDGSVSMASGDCVFVDLDFSSNATLTMQKATFQTLGVPTLPGSRLIVAWCLDTGGGPVVYTRDGNWPVGTLFQPATNLALGIVQLLTAANTVGTPIVPSIDTATNRVVAAGLSRKGAGGSLAAGQVAIGTDIIYDTSVLIGRSGANTSIASDSLLVNQLGTNAANSHIQANCGLYAFTTEAGGDGLQGTGYTTGAGGTFKGGASGPAVVAQELASNDKPLWYSKDRGGNTRYVVDHNGYPMGQLGIITENWWPDTLTANPTFANNGLMFNNRWKSNTNSGANTQYLYGPDFNVGPSVWMYSDTTNNHTFWTGTSTWLFARRSGSVMVAEWTFNLHDDLNQTWMHGFWDDGGGGTDPMTPGNAAAWFQRASGGNWKTFVLGGAAFDTGVAPTIGSFTRFRIEIYGDSTPLGVASGVAGSPTFNTVVRFFIDGTLVRTETNVSPWGIFNTAKFGWYCKNTAGLAGTGKGIMGPVRVVWNLFDNPTAL